MINYIKDVNVKGSSTSLKIDSEKFQVIIDDFCRSSDTDLDEHIFKVFDVLKSGMITKE